MIANTYAQNQIPLEVESDSMEVVSALSGSSEDLSEVKVITDAIGKLASKMNVVSFDHCNRSTNSVAHCIANFVCNFGSDAVSS